MAEVSDNVDTETFKVAANIDAGTEPTRIVMQPDGRYLWVGNNPRDGKLIKEFVAVPLTPVVAAK